MVFLRKDSSFLAKRINFILGADYRLILEYAPEFLSNGKLFSMSFMYL